MAEKLNQTFEIPLEQLEENIGQKINGNYLGYDLVVSPRELVRVDSLVVMNEEVFKSLIRNIPLRGTDYKLYAESKIQTYRREPKGFEIGQTFALEEKILGIMQNLEGKLFGGNIGLSKMPAAQIYGRDSHERNVLALYVPPIIEMHGNSAVLIDGIHRSYICSSAGTTINGVHINNVGAELPFKPIRWKDCNLVSEKPPKNERYIDLDVSLFRDLTAIGIDG
jgi:hypothetical protein